MRIFLLIFAAVLAVAQDRAVAPRPEWASYTYSALVPTTGQIVRPTWVESDPAGDTWVGGWTASAELPVTPEAERPTITPSECGVRRVHCGEGYLLKLDRQGRVLYATYLGAQLTAVAADRSGDVYVATLEKEVRRYGNNGRLKWARIGDVAFTHLAVSSTGEVYAAANAPNGSDIEVARLDAANGATLWRRTFGGSSEETVRAIAANTHLWIAGRTFSADFPLRDPVQSNLAGQAEGFVAAFAAETGDLYFSTYTGTDRIDEVSALAVGPGGVYTARTSDESTATAARSRVVVAEWTNPRQLADIAGVQAAAIAATATDLWLGGRTWESGLATADAFASGNNRGDTFLARLTTAGQITWFTYYGGSGEEAISDLALVADGDVLAAGATLSPDLPVVRQFTAGPHNAWVSRWTTRPQPDPALPANGTVSAFSFAGAIAPGGIVSLFGTDLARGVAHALALPLPADLLGTTVTFNGIPAPLFYVSPQQINAQVPFGISPGTAVVEVRRGTSVTQQRVEVRAVAPALWGQFVHPVYGATSEARVNETVLLYATGLGALERPVADGEAANSANPTVARVTAKIGSTPVVVEYAGAAPGFAGLYQINIVLPAVPVEGALVVSAGGVESNGVPVRVQQ